MSKPMVHLSTDRLMRQLIVSLDEQTQSNLALAQAMMMMAQSTQAMVERIDALFDRAGDDVAVATDTRMTDLGQTMGSTGIDYLKENGL